MDIEHSKSGSDLKTVQPVRRLYAFLAPRAYSVIIFSALFCTIAVKFFYSWREDLVSEYFGWILADIAVLLGIEIALSVICFRWPRVWVIRIATIFAAVVCTWSVMNAGWLIKTGVQILPAVLLPLIRDPISSLRMVSVSLIKMPLAAVMLLGPSAVALAFLFIVLAKPLLLNHSRKRFLNKIFISLVIIFLAVLARGVTTAQGSPSHISEELRYNCQLRAVMGVFWPDLARLTRADLTEVNRQIPVFDQIEIELPPEMQRINHNVVVVVLEGIQYKFTSLGDSQTALTPYLASLAAQGVEFVNTRSTLTHTTKALFSLLTGRFPSISHDIVEAVPAIKPYAGIAAILKQRLNYRTAFFQSADGSFEARPGLVYNLGFDKFWARDNLNDPNAFLGYLACDEFTMLEPIAEWIQVDKNPFFLTVLCSVTHDPYVVPEWFVEPAKEPVQRYRQAISYTDRFIAALDAKLEKLDRAEQTIFCVIGDHGEAFGEHGGQGHERIAFDEALRVPWIIRAPSLVEPGTKALQPVSSVDFVPTLLALFGFDMRGAGFDGLNALAAVPNDRKVYFSDWKHEGPAGFVKGSRKFIYNPSNKMVSVYDLGTDPSESVRIELDQQHAQKVTDDIISWGKSTIFQIDQQRTGEKMLFDSWLCSWKNRISRAKYQPGPED